MADRKSATLRDVAAEAKVSLATASRVISNRGYVSEESRRRVDQAIALLGYKVHGIARDLKRMKTKTVGLMIADIVNPFYATLAEGVLAHAKELGYRIILASANELAAMEKEGIEVFIEERVAGVLAIPTAESEDNWREILEFGTTVVAIDRSLSPELGLDSATVDNEGGAYAATRYLLELGHRRIGFINGPTNLTTGQQRLAGYLRAHGEAGLEADPRLIRSMSFRGASGHEAAKELLDAQGPSPTAIFAANNVLGEGAMTAIREERLSVPGDISLLIYDDVTWCRLTVPRITVVKQPTFQLGYEALGLLHRRLEEDQSGVEPAPPRSIVLKTELIVRESCSQPRR